MERLINILINEVLNPLIFLFFGLAAVFFLFGLIKYIRNADNQEKRTEGQRHIAWGILGIVIMLGAWGILEFFDNTLDEIAPGEESTFDVYRSN